METTDRAGFAGDPRDKADLVDRIRRGRAALDAAVNRLSPEQLTRPGPDGGWSVKDHLAHLSHWNRKLLSTVPGGPAWRGLGIDEAEFAQLDLDGINATLHERDRDKPLDPILAAYRQSHAEVVALLEGLPEAELHRAYAPGDPDDDRRVLDAVVQNTYGHDLEHLDWIRGVVERAG